MKRLLLALVFAAIAGGAAAAAPPPVKRLCNDGHCLTVPEKGLD